MGPHNSSPSQKVIQWTLDTRPLWPQAQATKDLTTIASRALSLLPPSERANVLKFYFVKDAKLALASALLKRLAITQYVPGVRWDDAVVTRDERTKPVFRLPDGTEPLLFNVSHQAGIVVLFGVCSHRSVGKGKDGKLEEPGVMIGVDIVCPSERRDRDLATISDQGWRHFIEVHEEVFSEVEVSHLVRAASNTQSPQTNESVSPSKEKNDILLETFYALWCLREAYVKMTGEALLASWLKQLAFENWEAPPRDHRHGDEMSPGVEKKNLTITFKCSRVEDVDVRMSWLLDDYMVCTAVKRDARGDGLGVGDFEILDIDSVLAEAEGAR